MAGCPRLHSGQVKVADVTDMADFALLAITFEGMERTEFDKERFEGAVAEAAEVAAEKVQTRYVSIVKEEEEAEEEGEPSARLLALRQQLLVGFTVEQASRESLQQLTSAVAGGQLAAALTGSGSASSSSGSDNDASSSDTGNSGSQSGAPVPVVVASDLIGELVGSVADGSGSSDEASDSDSSSSGSSSSDVGGGGEGDLRGSQPGPAAQGDAPVLGAPSVGPRAATHNWATSRPLWILGAAVLVVAAMVLAVVALIVVRRVTGRRIQTLPVGGLAVDDGTSVDSASIAGEGAPQDALIPIPRASVSSTAATHAAVRRLGRAQSSGVTSVMSSACGSTSPPGWVSATDPSDVEL